MKKWIIFSSVLVLLAAAGCGIWYYLGHNSKDPVYVYDFQMIGMTEYWGDMQESYGPVRTDKIQTVVLSDTQTVTEILVNPGDTVQKGDVLLRFDTTLSDLALERKRLEVEKLKLQLEEEKARLTEIRNMKPMVLPTYTEDPVVDENLGSLVTNPFPPSAANDGSTQQKAIIYWLGTNAPIDLEAVRAIAQARQDANAPLEPEETEPEETEPEETEPEETEPEETEPEESQPPETQPDSTLPAETEGNEESSGEGEENGAAQVSASTSQYKIYPLASRNAGDPVRSFYVIFKQTAGNMSKGQIITWQGMYVDMDRGTMTFFDASGIPDYSAVEQSVVEMPEIDFGSGYTAAQIAEMRQKQEKAIQELQFKIKMAEADYKIMQTETQDGNVYSQIDGKVVSLLPEEEARLLGQPIMKVSGGGGFYISCSISELEKDSVALGQEVTVMDYRSGMSYPGRVQSLGDYPVRDNGYRGMGNPNVSYYPMTVYVDETADLVEDYYVNVQYSLGQNQNGIYLENPFLRTEQGSSYVYVLGENDRLERRTVLTGKSLWGSYTEILEGLLPTDKIAFPYGKNVKPGVSAVTGDYSTLYG